MMKDDRTAIILTYLWLMISNINNSYQTQDTVYYRIEEEIPLGKKIGNLVIDADIRSQYDSQMLALLTYRFLQESDSNDVYFDIDNESGDIKIAKVIDRDVLCPGEKVCILKQDAASVTPKGHLEVIALEITVEDKNDNQPKFPEKEFFMEIPESASIGAAYNLPTAVDTDSDIYNVQYYELTSGSNVFSLEETNVNEKLKTLQLKLMASLDREKSSNYQLLVSAFDGGIPPKSANLKVRISVGDVNDHSPVFVKPSQTIILPEDTALHRPFMAVTATDEDTGINSNIHYSFTSPVDISYFEEFDINEEDGSIFLIKPIDYEKQKEYHLVVEAKDGGANSQPAYAHIFINVSDVNDNAPHIISNTANGDQVALIPENSSITKFISHLTVKDPDTGNGGLFECNINDPSFKLKFLSKSSYEVVTLTEFDREYLSHYSVRVVCHDLGSPSQSSFVDIPVKITDMNDNVPSFDENIYYVKLKENNEINTYLVQVNATDRDEGLNAKLHYMIDDEFADRFIIDSSNGRIATNSIFDFETDETTLTVILKAVDSGKPELTGTSSLIIILEDVDDESPVFSKNQYEFNITENDPVGFVLGSVSAVDKDSEQFNSFSYMFQRPSQVFNIDDKSGIIRTIGLVDREKHSNYSFNILAVSSNSETVRSGIASLKINVLDLNDNSPTFVFPNRHNQSLQISSQTPAGAYIGKILAFDPDEGDNAKIYHYISSGNEGMTFKIDINTGMITSQTSLSQIDIKTFDLMITLQDGGKNSQSSSNLLYIKVNSSLPYFQASKGLNTKTNILIVILLGSVSSFIIIILITCIAMIRIRDNKRRKNIQHAYKHPLELNSSPNESSNLSNSAFISPSDENRTKYDKLDPASSFDEKVVPSSADEDHYIPAEHQFLENHYLKMRPPQRHYSPSVSSSENGQLPLSVTNLHMTKKYSPQRDHDSDSAYSGDMSNSDNGGPPHISEVSSTLKLVDSKEFNVKYPFQNNPNRPIVNLSNQVGDHTYYVAPSYNQPSRWTPTRNIENGENNVKGKLTTSFTECNTLPHRIASPLSHSGPPGPRIKPVNKPYRARFAPNLCNDLQEMSHVSSSTLPHPIKHSSILKTRNYAKPTMNEKTVQEQNPKLCLKHPDDLYVSIPV